MLDSQLKEKSTTMESYVKELSELRNQVAKIKRNQERELSQLRDSHTKELQQVSKYVYSTFPQCVLQLK